MFNCSREEDFKISHGVIKNPLMAEFNRHFHREHEILLHISGDADYSIDGSRYTLRPFDLLLIPSSMYHFAIPLSDRRYENYVINIGSGFTSEEKLEKLFSPPYVINIGDDALIKGMFSLLDRCSESYTEEDFAEAARHIVHEILIYASYKPKMGRSGSTDDIIARITEFIGANLERELNADIIARELSFSRSYIQNRFSQSMGIGLKHYINQKRIYAAHSDIKNGLSPYQAADKYGYGNYSSFFRQYVKIFGESPQKAKKQTATV